MAAVHTCGIPVGVFSVIAVFSNITMIIFVFKRDGTKRGFYIILLCIGLINAVTSAPMTAFLFISENFLDNDMKDKTIASTFLVSLHFFQLHLNLALAYDRYLAVSEPIEHRTAVLMKKSKRYLITGAACVLVISAIIAYLSANYLYLKLPIVAVGCARFITFLSLTVIYYKLVRSYKKSQAITESFNTTSTVQTAAHRVREMNERHMTYKCVGITLSFVILNLPLAVASIFFPETELCSTQGGIIMFTCLTLDAFNRAIDPIWYFYMDRRELLHNRLSVQVMQNRTINVTSRYTEN